MSLSDLLERIGLKPRRSYGLNGLDLKLLRYVRRRGGFFVEAGANNGVDQSNTAYLERELGWRGILIEPIPHLAEACRRNRPNAIVEQCALTAAGFSEPTVEMNYCNLMSLVQGARGSVSADEAHLAIGRTYLSEGDEVYTVQVPARTLTDILDQHDVSQFDLLSLDVEGYEAEVLRGLDLSKYKPEYILVEANCPDDIHLILSPNYDFVSNLSHHDRLYKLKNNSVIS